jgi:hypothetical protein
VYSREIDDQVLTLAASGWTFKRTFVLYDHETESLWYHLPGTNGLTCVNGFYVDRFLPELTSTRIRWNKWVEQRPNSKFLKCKVISLGFCAEVFPDESP